MENVIPHTFHPGDDTLFIPKLLAHPDIAQYMIDHQGRIHTNFTDNFESGGFEKFIHHLHNQAVAAGGGGVDVAPVSPPFVDQIKSTLNTIPTDLTNHAGHDVLLPGHALNTDLDTIFSEEQGQKVLDFMQNGQPYTGTTSMSTLDLMGRFVHQAFSGPSMHNPLHVAAEAVGVNINSISTDAQYNIAQAMHTAAVTDGLPKEVTPGKAFYLDYFGKAGFADSVIQNLNPETVTQLGGESLARNLFTYLGELWNASVSYHK
jgi:hypothetical protein